MSGPSTIHELLQAGSDDSTAISGIDRAGLTFAGLRQLVADTAETLNGLGVGRNDRVAIVLANGPEMATAFVAVSACATTAPLNPLYTRDEYDFYLSDIDARAVIVSQGSESPAIDAATTRGIPILELRSDADRPAGTFTLDAGDWPFSGADCDAGIAWADDNALVLHTSGTTSRPKIVPLSQRNVCASARNIQQTLGLESDDGGGRCSAG